MHLNSNHSHASIAKIPTTTRNQPYCLRVLKGWKSFDESDPTYMVMDEEFSVKSGEEMPNQERYKFWDSQDVFWNYALGRSTISPKEEL